MNLEIIDKIFGWIHTGLQFFRELLTKIAEAVHIEPSWLITIVLVTLSTIISYQFFKKMVTRPWDYLGYLIVLIIIIYALLYRL